MSTEFVIVTRQHQGPAGWGPPYFLTADGKFFPELRTAMRCASHEEAQRKLRIGGYHYQTSYGRTYRVESVA